MAIAYDKALILGLGKSGIACAHFLAAQGVELVLADTRDDLLAASALEACYPSAPLHLGNLDLAILDSVDAVVISPGLDPRHPIVKKAYALNMPVVGDVELFAQVVDKPVIAITGSNGKSTVTVLLGKMAAAQGLNVVVGGNLGCPAVELLDPKADLYIIELSSFQLETTASLQARAATILNLSPDHLDRYDDFAQYCKVKQRVFKHAEHAIINLDDELLAKLPAELKTHKLITFSLQQKADVYWQDGYIYLGQQRFLSSQELKLFGSHNVANVLSCLAVATALDWQLAPIKTVLQQFGGLKHRMQHVLCANNVNWVNDSKATNVGATCAAVNSLSGSLVIILGGVDKAQDFSQLAQLLKQKAHTIILIGNYTKALENALFQPKRMLVADSMAKAVSYAKKWAQAGDTVLLSPACASYDWYQSFEQRGDDFVAQVQAIVAGSDSAKEAEND